MNKMSLKELNNTKMIDVEGFVGYDYYNKCDVIVFTDEEEEHCIVIDKDTIMSGSLEDEETILSLAYDLEIEVYSVIYTEEERKEILSRFMGTIF